MKDCDSGCPIEDSQKIDIIESRLKNVLKGDNDIRSAKTSVSMEVTHTERRLHQMMFVDRDYERKPTMRTNADCPLVTVQNCLEWGYSVVNVQCKDRTKLLFDVVCTLTDMQYVVFHTTINTSGDQAYMSIIKLHDGSALFVIVVKYLSPALHDIDQVGITPDVQCTTEMLNSPQKGKSMASPLEADSCIMV